MDNKVTPSPCILAFSPASPSDEFTEDFYHYVSSSNCFTDNSYNLLQMGAAVTQGETGLALQELAGGYEKWGRGSELGRRQPYALAAPLSLGQVLSWCKYVLISTRHRSAPQNPVERGQRPY